MKATIKKIIFWTAIIFILVTIFSLTVGQELSYEFANYKVMHKFYDIIMQGLPLSILLTLFGTIKGENTKIRNWTLLILTILSSIISIGIMISLIFRIGFGAWTNLKIIYRHKTEDKVIIEQLFDKGALGYGGKRIVEIKPIFKYWILPTTIDTLTINQNEWQFIKEQTDIKFP